MEPERRQKILIADGSEPERSLLAGMLGGEYEIIEAEDGEQAAAVLRAHGAELSLVLLAAAEPDGFAVLELMNRDRWIEDIPVLMIAADGRPAHIERAYALGAADCIRRPFHALAVRRRAANTILLHAGQNERGAAERALGLLERERTRNDFFASLTGEIQFEYTRKPPMLTLSAWGAGRLGLEEGIADPLHNKGILGMVRAGELRELGDLLHGTTPEHPVISYDCRVKTGGEERWFRIVAQAVWSAAEGPPRYTGAIGKAVDIHDSRMKLAELERKASHDALTGLFNRDYARERIQDRLEARPAGRFALLVFDLDHFKSANDTYGHQFGDRVLAHVAERLRRSIRGGDIAARAGGDEFLIFLEYKTELEPVVRRIFAALSGQYGDFALSVSMGVARSDAVGAGYEELFRAADRALYAAKRSGRGQYRFCGGGPLDPASPGSPHGGEREPPGGAGAREEAPRPGKADRES